MTATVELKLRDDAPFDTADVIASLTPSIVIDDNLRRDASERLGLFSVTVDGASVEVKKDFEVRLGVVKDRITVVEAESDEFDRDLYASLVLEVRVATDHAAETAVQA